MTGPDKLSQLQAQIDRLLQQQLASITEIRRLQQELQELRAEKTAPEPPPKPAFFQKITPAEPPAGHTTTPEPVKTAAPAPPPAAERPEQEPPSRDWEQFIGGNLINKIGIVILLIGLGLFVKYAIDKGYFPPPVRVVLGYLSGIVLIFLAWRLEEKYTTYSAVLFGGGMAVLYFTTYTGCTFFEPAIVPVLPAFIFMAVLMTVTLVVAGRYNLQIIGLLGLVGAYAVPFLVNTGSENFVIFFSYITLINVGVLILAAKKVWRTMTWSACILTWVIAFASLISHGSQLDDSAVMWAFSFLSFLIFYAAILAPQRWNPQKISSGTYLLAGINALLFYVLTLSLSTEIVTTGGLTFLHSIPHFAAAFLLWKKLEHKFPTAFFTLIGLVFVTMAIPIEFETQTVLWLWTAEAVALFFVARKFASRMIEIAAWVVGILTILTLMGTWNFTGDNLSNSYPAIFNWNFATHLWVLGGAIAFHFLNEKLHPEHSSKALNAILKIIPVVLLYFLFFNELYHWFDPLIATDTLAGMHFSAYRTLWLFNYTALFLTALAALNFTRWKNENLGTVVISGGILLIAGFLSIFMQELNFLRDDFLTKNTGGVWMIGIRYVSYVFFAGLVAVTLKTLSNHKMIVGYEKFLPLLPHLVILAVLSHELATATFLALGTTASPVPNREGFSILWGVYSLLLIGLGIRKKSQVLRVAGMCLFGITLVKVFFMDLGNLPIISRTLLFIGLGGLLLFTSYLYQKFRDAL